MPTGFPDKGNYQLGYLADCCRYTSDLRGHKSRDVDLELVKLTSIVTTAAGAAGPRAATETTMRPIPTAPAVTPKAIPI